MYIQGIPERGGPFSYLATYYKLVTLPIIMTAALKLPSTRNLAIGLFGLVLSCSLLFAAAPKAQAAGLTSTQISAILSLLQSFGTDQSTISNVNAALNGGTVTGGTVVPPKPTEANIYGTPSSGAAPLTVKFSTSLPSTFYAPYINFGDGSTGTMSRVPDSCSGSSTSSCMEYYTISHTYAAAGTYVVRGNAGYVCTAPAGAVCTSALLAINGPTINVNSGTTTTQASIYGTPTSGAAPLSVFFSTSLSRDLVAPRISFGDGTSETMTWRPSTCSTSSAVCLQGYSVSHTYTAGGSYKVTGSTSPIPSPCPAGAACMAPLPVSLTGPTINVVGSSTQPTLSAIPASGTAPLTVTFKGSMPGTSYTLNYGDGSAPVVYAVAIDCLPGTYDCAAGFVSQVYQTHTYKTAGTYTATLSGNGKIKTVTVTVNGATTEANIVAVPTSGTAPLTVKFGTSLPSSFIAPSITFGDGATATMTSVPGACFGSSTASCMQYYTTSHTYRVAGSYKVSGSASYACPTGTVCPALALAINGPTVKVAAPVTTRALCGLFRGGTSTATNMVASPNPASSVADNATACISYCDASGPRPGDMCRRGDGTVKTYPVPTPSTSTSTRSTATTTAYNVSDQDMAAIMTAETNAINMVATVVAAPYKLITDSLAELFYQVGVGANQVAAVAAAPAPSVTVFASNSTKQSSNGTFTIPGGLINILWSSKNAKSCSFSPAPKAVSSDKFSAISAGTSGYVLVKATQDVTYTVTCTNANGVSTSGSIAIVISPKPTITLFGSNSTKQSSGIFTTASGNLMDIIWSTTNITSCNVTPAPTVISPAKFSATNAGKSGALLIKPTETVTYTFNCINSNEIPVSASLQIVVSKPVSVSGGGDMLAAVVAAPYQLITDSLGDMLYQTGLY